MSKVAIVTGATGIVGSEIIGEILNTKNEEWSKVIAVSRREPILSKKDSRYHFLPIDLSQDQEHIVSKLKEGGAQDVTHVFYTAYIHDKSWDPNNLYNTNVPMFTKFIKAIDSIATKLERIELQTGCKYYGIHKGSPKDVIDDSTPRYTPEPGQPDFYFGQEDFLKDFQKGKNWKYTIYRPNAITGVTRGNGMSIAPTLAVYFTVQKHLGKKALYPGNEVSYKSIFDCSNANLIAKFAIFTSCNKAAENEDFLIIDHDSIHQTGEEIWKAIANYFGVEVEEPTFANSTSKPKGNGHPVLEYALTDYMKDKKEVWKEIAQKYGVDEKMYDYATWDFADAIFSFSWPQHFRMSKAKKIGWNLEKKHTDGFTDSFDHMKKWKMIP